MKTLLQSHMAAVLMLGLVSQIAQVLMLRELLMVFHGNELSMGIIFSAWLAWVGVGSLAGGWIAGKLSRPAILVGMSAMAILVLLPGVIFLIRTLRGFFNIPPGAYLSLWDMTLSSFLLMGPVCFLLGVQFVVLSRIWREKGKITDASGAAGTYMGESVGNMMGGLLFTLLMVHYLDSFQSAFAVSLFMLISAVILHLGPLPGVKSMIKLRFFLLMAFVMLLSAPVFFLLDRVNEYAWKVQWQHITPGYELEAMYQSKHGNIAVLRHQDQLSFFQSGHLMFSTAGPETQVPGMEEQEAVVFAHFAMTQHPEPEDVLLIGGGLRGVLAEILKHPVKRIDYIELDPVLTMAVKNHASPGAMEALSDPRVRLIHTDARHYVKQARHKYDLIMVDAPDPATAVLNRYYTREFFNQAGNILKPGGIIATGLVSTPDLRGRAVANRNASIYHTMVSVFASVLPVGDRFLFYFGSGEPDGITADPDILQKRYEERGISAQGFSGLHFHIILEETQLRRVNWTLRNHGRSPEDHIHGPRSRPVLPDSIQDQQRAEKQLAHVQERYFINSDFKPIGYFYTLMFWDQLTRSGQKDILELFLRINPWLAAPFIFAAIAAVSGLALFPPTARQKADVRFAILFTAFTTGFSTMVLQVALLFSFQSIYGFIYETVGLIVALFMFGLAMGAFMAQRRIRDKSSLKTLAIIQAIMAVSAVGMALIIPMAAEIKGQAMVFILFAGLTLYAGFINGIDFPLTANCYMALGKGAERSAAYIYGTELAGACFGAVLAGAVVAPVMGIAACCFLAGMACAAAFAGLMICRGFHS